MGEEKHLPERISLKEMRGKHPELYSECFGCAVGGGWRILVETLNDILLRYNNKEPDKELHYRVHQVKEKFGGLRFYYSGGNAEDDKEDSPHKYSTKSNNINYYVEMAEILSYRTCEQCGDAGERRDTSWVLVYCNACYLKHLLYKKSVTVGYSLENPDSPWHKTELQRLETLIQEAREQQEN